MWESRCTAASRRRRACPPVGTNPAPCACAARVGTTRPTGSLQPRPAAPGRRGVPHHRSLRDRRVAPAARLGGRHLRDLHPPRWLGRPLELHQLHGPAAPASSAPRSAGHTLVTDMNQLPDGRWEVICNNDRIVCEHVVNAAGHYAPQLGAMVGLDVPIVSVIPPVPGDRAHRGARGSWLRAPTDPGPARSIYARCEWTACWWARTRCRARSPTASTGWTGTCTSTSPRPTWIASRVPGVGIGGQPGLRGGRHPQGRVGAHHAHSRRGFPDGAGTGAAQLLALQRRIHSA